MDTAVRNLKVCEACGGLFIQVSSTVPYCRRCTAKMFEIPGRTRRGVLTTLAATEEAAAPLVFRKVTPADLAAYRAYTEAILRRYGVVSVASGRLPGVLGRELFRSGCSHRSVSRFDDVVNFVVDVEAAIRELAPGAQRVLLRIGVQEYTFAEASRMFYVGLRTISRRYYGAIDELTAVFLRRGLLERIETICSQPATAVA